MAETWDFLESPAGDAAQNMAVDEVLLRTAAQRGRPLLRVYSWLKPAVSIGYFQEFPVELEARCEIVRRPTGGGLVYHGEDTTFTIVVPPGHELHRLRTTDAYCRIHEAVARILGATIYSALEVARGQYECFQRPVAGDVMAEGRKLAGGAQRRNRDGMLHQGSIAAKLNARQLAAVFDVRFESYRLSAEEVAMVTWLADGKYRTDAWNKKHR
jgi:lipoate-protein ligase A